MVKTYEKITFISGNDFREIKSGASQKSLHGGGGGGWNLETEKQEGKGSPSSSKNFLQ